MSDEIRINLDKIQEAVDIRRGLKDMYAQYGVISKAMQVVALIEHSDFKGAVDAIYYLGGGWPTENSKGRMERLLDNFSGMYKVLTLIGKGNLVEEHLAEQGIVVQLQQPLDDTKLSEDDIRYIGNELELKPFGFKAKTTAGLMKEAVNYCLDLQRSICQGADAEKDLLKSAGQGLEIDNAELSRLEDLTRLKDVPKRSVKKRNGTEISISNYRTTLKSFDERTV